MGVAEERMRAWGNSVKSQALRDAVEKQLRKMKETDAPAPGPAEEASEDSGKGKAANVKLAVRETRKKGPTSPERGPVPAARGGGRSLGGSADSSGSAAGDMGGKHTALFTPPKNKENKTKAEPGESPPKHGSVWKAVFHRKDTKKDDQSQRGLGSETADSANDSSPLGQSSGELRCCDAAPV